MKMAESNRLDQLYIAPGNAGTANFGINVNLNPTDVASVYNFCKEYQIALVVPGNEDPLVAGITDYIELAAAADGLQISVAGPSAWCAQLEGSKDFSKAFMGRHNIPTARYQSFQLSQLDEAAAFLKTLEPPYVLKADGLAAGKGVFVCLSKDEAREAIRRVLVHHEFGKAGSEVVIEEFLVGEEASLLAFVDGTTIVPLEAAQDHKSAFDGDSGPNTGGMGAYSPTPVITTELTDLVVEKILIPIVHEMQKAGRRFCGCLYAGLMLTNQGPKVLEFNVRLGDPETQAVLMRLKSDLAHVLFAAADGKLHEIEPLEWDPRSSVCVVMASAGYPSAYETGKPLRGLDAAARVPDSKVFHAGTIQQGDQIMSDGGRVLGSRLLVTLWRTPNCEPIKQ